MKKRLLLSGLAAVVGLLLSAGPARAAGGLAVDVHFADSNPGSYHVTLSNISGSTWSINVKSNNDFASLTPEHNVSQVLVTFYGDLSGITVLNSSADTGSGSTNIAWGTEKNSSVFKFQADPTGADYITMNASNQLAGSITLASSAEVRAIRVALVNGIGVTSGPTALNPEPVSLALALPGLLPLGFLVRRRRGREPPI